MLCKALKKVIKRKVQTVFPQRLYILILLREVLINCTLTCLNIYVISEKKGGLVWSWMSEITPTLVPQD